MKALTAPLNEYKEFTDICEALAENAVPIQVTGCIDSQKCHFIHAVGAAYPFRLIITGNERKAKELYEDYRVYDRNVMLYPTKDIIFYNADIHGNAILRARMRILKRLIERRPVTVITGIDGGLDRLLPLTQLAAHVLRIRETDSLDLQQLTKQLVLLGYTREGLVESPGSFAVRGGILDIFPLTEEAPYRIEFWGDEIDSIRTFDVSSQRSIERISEVVLYPASELVLDEEARHAGIARLKKEAAKQEKVLRDRQLPEEAARCRSTVEEFLERLESFQGGVPLDSYIRYFCQETVSFFDYFSKEDSIIFLDEPARLVEKGEACLTEFSESMTGRLEKGYILPAQSDAIFDYKQLLAGLANKTTLLISSIEQKCPFVPARKRFDLTVSGLASYHNNFDLLVKDLQKWKKNGYRIILFSASRTRAARLAGELLERELPAFYKENPAYTQNESVDTAEASAGAANADASLPSAEAANAASTDASQSVTGTLAPASTIAGTATPLPSEAAYDASTRVLAPGEIMVTQGTLHRGFEYPLLKFVLISESDLFGGEKKQRRTKKSPAFEGRGLQNFNDLSTGDYVVHENHGMGIYRGIEQIEVDRVQRDYIKIEYGDGGVLYVSASDLNMIQKYANADARKPKLNKLNSVEWKNTKARVHGAVTDLADELIRLYAARQAKSGHRFGKDTVWQKEFEELFPYEATDDQLRAIADTKRDMESTRIMDRLICGDVGYGKTEVALRAAFKAVVDGKQVAVLVPTTILAQQHYNTFTQRMKDFSVEIEMLSRFRTAAEQTQILARIKKGRVDIVIGTHRILSKDVVFRDLGLLIVDEEQRFGVSHKEKIKQMREDIDVLTLTATPIPRTLHMSLVGIRDMSVLYEPPVDRLPIQTFVLEANDELIREAICRELARGGQVYYVHNRVNGIDEIASRVAKLVPDAEVAYAHGQMNERTLEKIMYDFINGAIDVLVSTTIIETGLDISNVNTIIINDADKFGLAQLYQLRGRVGRANRTAYAFLMYKRDKILREVAEKRLAAIREFTELGSGFKIAMRDLEIRGAGNLLGAEQSGNMEAVGYDLYCKMLNEAVLARKGGEEEQTRFETTVDIDVTAFIPPDYIPNEMQKLDTYKRIAGIETEEEYTDMQDELIDRYGTIPAPVENLLSIALLRALAHEAQLVSVSHKGSEVKLVPRTDAPYSVEKLPALLLEYGGRLKMTPGAQPSFVYKLGTVRPTPVRRPAYGRSAVQPAPLKPTAPPKNPIAELFTQLTALLSRFRLLLPMLLLVCCLSACTVTNISFDDPTPTAGASISEDNTPVPTFAENELLTIDSVSVPASEVLLYLLAAREEVELLYGDGIWEYVLDKDGTTYGDLRGEQILEEIIYLKTVCLQAEALDIALQEDEVMNIADYEADFLATIGSDKLRSYGISDENVRQVYVDNTIALKVYERITLSVDTDIPDAEARQMVLQYIFKKNYTEDADGVKIPLSDIAIQELLASLDAIAIEARTKDNFYNYALTKTDAGDAELVVGYNDLPLALSTAAFALYEGEFSPIIETEDGYYLLYCAVYQDEDATNAKKEQLIVERQDALFAETYALWREATTVAVNRPLWDSLEVTLTQ